MMMDKLYSTFLASSGVNTDTRSIANDQLFFALKGPSFNGNTYAQKAIDLGAIAVVVDEDVQVEDPSRVFRVEDVLATLQGLARHHRNHLKCPVIGMTGSNGKTTAKELFRSVLSQKFNVVATQGNLNNHIGVPLTILGTPNDCEILIVEMGANHQGEIELLSSISQPNIGYITNFGKAHLEGFGGIEGVIKGKSELYDYLRENNRTALVNAFDNTQMEKSDGIERITYGDGSSEYPMTYLEQHFPASVEYQNSIFTSNLTGSFHTANIGAAVALGLHFKLSIGEIQAGISGYTPKNNRSEWRITEHNKVMLDAYNANPSSMAASLDSFMSESTGERLIVLGDMFELGSASVEEHQNIANLCSKLEAEIILVGSHFKNTTGKALRYETTEEALKVIKDQEVKGKTILLKGSRGMHLESLMEVL